MLELDAASAPGEAESATVRGCFGRSITGSERGEQPARGERLVKKSVHVIALGHIVAMGFRAADDDGNLRQPCVCLSGAEKRPAIHDRHREVEQHNARDVAMPMQPFEGLLAISGGIDHEAFVGEHPREKLAEICVVVDDEDHPVWGAHVGKVGLNGRTCRKSVR